MAWVRILPAITFTSYEHAEGDAVDLRDDIALTWCNAGLAEPAETPEDAAAAEVPEAAAAETPEDGTEPATTRRAPRAASTRKAR